MRSLLLFCSCLCFAFLNAQNEYTVSRGFKIDRSAPIQNIHVDSKGLKWVADELGLVLIQSANFAEPLPPKEEEWSLLSVPRGNFELSIPKTDLQKYLGKDLSIITTAQYDETRQELWIGTSNAGLFHLKTSGGLSLIANRTNKNSKLRSNTIQTILVVAPGQLWVGTNDGLLEIQSDKSKLHGKGISIEAITVNNGQIWAVSDGELLEFDKKKSAFYFFELKEYMTEGLVKDIAFDSRERLWVASEIILRYDFDAGKHEIYGPIQEFTSQNVNCIAVDFDDALWVGTQDKGLYFIGKSSTLLAEVVLDTPLDCKPNSTNAALQVRASGGRPPYTYKWSENLKGEKPKNIGAGTYNVTVSDQDNNTAEASIEIESNQFTVAVQQERPASLGGNADGQAQVTITPDSRNFKIQWDNGENTRLAQKLNTGKHSVTITGEKGCTTEATVEIDEALAPLSVALEEKQGIDCPGNSTASIFAKATGGQAPYTYTWNPAAEGKEQLENLAAGVYALVINDAAGSSAKASITIAEPVKMEATVSPVSAATTNNADGKAKVKVKGGNGKYTYKWDSEETTETATKLAAGQHSLTVTDGAGCNTTASFDISENILTLAVALKELTKIKCAGESTAVVEASISGGKAPFQYTWSTDKGSDQKASDLGKGNYSLTVTDAAGNNATKSIAIAAPDPLTATASPRSAASTNNKDGKAKVTAKGGSGKYTYKWDNGETTQTAEKLGAGTHSVSIVDASACTTTATVDITENILEFTVALEETTAVKCAGGSTAILQAIAGGGKPPFQYQWSTDKGKAEKASGLSKGKYQVTVTDAAGTAKTAEATIKEPAPLSLKIQQTAPASTNNADGQAKAIASGGTGNYTYKWSSSVTTATVSGLAPGNHSLTLTDQNGCTTNSSIEITENILPLAVNISQTATIDCFGEKTAGLEVEVQGGKAPFLYSWSTPALAGKTGTKLGAGAYTVSVSDASGANQSASITIEEPEALTVTMDKPGRATNADSKDGKASLTITGGTPAYTVTWSNSETGLTAQKLPIGTHSVSITDSKGCKETQSVDIKKKNLPALTAGRLSAGQTLQVSQIYFDADSIIMNPNSYPVVNEIADFLEENPLIVIEVGGHTNNIPPHEFCDNLSAGRAQSVASYIVEKGVDPTRVVAKGYGKRKPKYSNKTSDGRKRNQRVEIKILRLN